MTKKVLVRVVQAALIIALAGLINACGGGAESTPPPSTPPPPAALRIDSATLANATISAPYSAALAASGGTSPYTWSLTAGNLPAGMTLSSAGTISGTSSATGTFTFTVQVRDSASQTTTRQLTLTVNPPALTIDTTVLAGGTIGVAYSATVTASGGTAPITLSVSAGNLPAGLSFAASGAITGTPTAIGTSTFTVAATDAVGQSVSRQFQIIIGATNLVLNSQNLPAATAGAAYTTTLSVSGGLAPYSFTLQSGTLPVGLSLSSSGTISGTPTVAGTANFTLQVTDGSGQIVSRQFSLSVNAAPVAITTTSLTVGNQVIQGSSVNTTVTVTGGTAPFTFSIAAGALPPGVTLAANGTLSGTPTALGTYTFTIQVNDATGQSVSQQFSLIVNPPVLAITTQAVPSATVNVAYNAALAATGGVTPYNWTVSAGALPAGITLSTAGTLSGTPTALGTFNFTVQVSDGSSQTASRQFSLTVGATQLSITTPTLPAGTLTVAYNQSIAAAGGLAPYNFTVSAGALPAGLTMSTAGVITGTPTALGTANFTVNVTDASAQSVSQQFSITVSATTLSVATQTLSNATVNVAYNATLTPNGGVAPYTWTVASGALPAGVTLAANGTLSGTPTVVGSFNFTAQVNDGSSQTASRQFTLTVVATQLSITTPTLPAGTLTVAYNQSIAAAGGLAPYNFTVSAGALPAGLTMSTAGVITGTPTALGTSNFTVNVTDASSQSVSQQFSITVNATTLGIATQSVPSGTVNVAYNATLTPNGGVAPYTWTVASGALPAGVTLAANGTLSGTPTVVGSFNFTAQVSDGSAQSATRQFTLTVNATQLSITTTTLPDGTLTIAYNQSIAVSGGLAPYNFTVSAGALPAGLTMSTAGVITGTPTALGTSNFTVNVTDASSQSVSQQFTITVNATTLSVATQTVPNATAGSAYTTTITSAGGVAPYAWSVASGTLPTGITLAANGTLSGTTNDVGAFNFTARVDDGSAQSATRQFTLTVNAAALDFVTTTLPAGVQGTAYAANITLSGGLAPYVFSSSGTLPTGVTLSASGAFSGTPTALGTFNFTVIVDDNSGQHIERQFQIIINPTSLKLDTLSVPDGVVNTAYSTTLSASGGAPAYSWSVTGGTLPTGLAINPGTGEISGTPTVSGTFNFTVQVTDSAAQSQSRGFTIVINPSTLVINTLTLPDGTLSVAYNSTITASGGTPAFTFAVDSGTVPTGLTLSTGGVLSGTPTAIGQFSFVARVDDSAAQSATRSFTVTINPSALQITTQTLPDTVVGSSYSQTLASTGGVAPFTWDVTSGSVPTGLTLSTGGLLSGTPSAAGTFTFTARVSDGSSQQASRQFTIVVAPPPLSLDTLSLPAGTVGTAYNNTLTASGGTPTYTWAVTAGTLPTGLALSPGGALSGTPTANGTSNITIRVTDSAGTPQQASRQFALTINPQPLQITNQTVPDGVAGVAYSQTLASSGGVAPFTWTITAGSLPTGLTLSTAGAITGTPSTAGSFTFTARVADGSSQQASRQYTIVIAPPPLSLDTLSLPAGTVGTAYSTTLAASGGTPAYAWAVTAGSLPAGLALSTGGVLSGTPTANGTSNVTIRVTDAAGTPQQASRQFALTINPPPLQITTQTVPDGVVGVAYSQTLASSGGVAPFTWTVTAGMLPSGLALSTAGAITGTPSAAGTFTFTARVQDGAAQQAARQYTIVIAPPPLSLDTLSLPAGTVGTAYSTTLTASGGTPTYTWAVTAGTLPAGLTLSTGGVLSGTPTANGSATITIRVTDSAGTPQQASRQFTLTINPAPLQITTQTVSDGVVGIAYSQTLVSSGGVAPFTWTVTAGGLPTGLTLSTSGAISGTPSAAGSFTFTARVADGSSQQASRQYTIVIAPPPLSLDTLSLPSGTVGTAYSTTLTASGGTPAYAWAVTAGTLPAGLTLSTGGVLSGTPTANGSATITIRVTDSAGTPQQASRQFTLTINPTPLQITTQTVPDTVVGASYTTALVSSGGVAPYTWTITAGALPTGLTLSTGGTLSGTPSATGSFTFTARVADGSAQQASRQFTIVVAPPALSLDTLSLPNGTVGTAYNATLTASGGTPPYTFAVTAGTLPAGLTLSTGGVLSGTPSASGAATVTLRVQDAAGTPQQASRQFTVTINPPPLQIATQTVPDTIVGASYSQTLSATGGVTPFTWTITAGSLPTGLTLSTAGVISGTPSASGTFVYTVQVADNSSQVATRQFTTVVAAPSLTLDTLSLPDASQNSVYNATLAASGGTGPYTWDIVAGALPAGLTLQSAGSITGTPTVNGSFSVTIRVQDSTAQSAQRQFTLFVTPPPLLINTPSLPNAQAGSAYSTTLSGSGGVPPYTWSIESGALPPGLTLNGSTGVISGTPTVTGQTQARIRLTDSTATFTNRDFTLNVVPVFRITTNIIWGGILGQQYNFTVQTADGTPAITWSLASGTLPTGLSLNTATGEISGTPSATGLFTFTLQAVDATAKLVSRKFDVIISPSDSNYGNVGDPYATEGFGPDGNAVLLTACANLNSNTSYRVTQNIAAATPGTNCFTLNTGTKLDLGGRIITGRISMNTNASGTVLFNGTVNCTWPDNGGDAGCVKLLSQSQASKEMRVHHLTILNSGTPGRALHVNWPMANIPSFFSLRIYNITATVPSQPTALRSFAMSLLVTNQVLEVGNNDLTCTAEASACQAIMCFTAGNCKMHHNRLTMNFYTPPTGDVGRAMLFDGNTLNGEAWNNLVTSNNHRALRIRDSYNIRVHHNTFNSITSGPHAIAAIHLADPDAGATNDLNALVDNNHFQMAGGVVFFHRNGFNILVRNNTYSCLGCTGSLLGTIRSPIAPSTRSEIRFENNADVILHLPPPQLNIFVGATATMCNSGVGGGAGTVVNVGCDP